MTGEYGSVTAADVRREALRLINNVVTNSLKGQALEAFGYISGVTDLAATLIGEEEDGE